MQDERSLLLGAKGMAQTSTQGNGEYQFLEESSHATSPSKKDISHLKDDVHLEGVLGYESILHRSLGQLSSFAFGFTEVGVLASFTSLYGTGLALGGPRTLVFSWLLSWAMLTLASLSMAELCSAYPLAGSVYNWAAQVVPAPQAPLASFVTAFFNALGNAAGDASFASFFATFFNAALEASGLPTYSSESSVAISILVLLIWTGMNWLRVDSLGWFQNVSAITHVLSIVIIIVAILVGAAHSANGLQSSRWVWTHYENQSGFTDDPIQHTLNSKAYIETLGVIVAMFAFSGFEASAHLAEETEGSQTTAPRGIIYTVLATGLGGFLYLLALLYATNDYETITRVVAPPKGSSDIYYTSNVAVNVFVNSCGWHCGAFLAWLVCINIFFAGVAAVAVTGRIIYALVRDGALPFSSYFAELHPTFKSPFRCVNLVCAFDACLLLLGLNPNTGFAFQAIVGLCNCGFMVSYSIPITLKCYYQPADFPQTAMSLGVLSFPIGVLASSWLYGTSLLNFLPQQGPLTYSSANYTGVVFLALAFLAFYYWKFGGGRESFTGPKRQVKLSSLVIDEKKGDVVTLAVASSSLHPH